VAKAIARARRRQCETNPFPEVGCKQHQEEKSGQSARVKLSDAAVCKCWGLPTLTGVG